MLKALVPVDGSDNSLSAVRHVIKLIQDREPIEVHLLNVQPELRGDVTAFVPQDVVQDYHVEEANKAMKAACELLDSAAIHYTKHVHVGDAADVIAECAKDLRCNEVIMGTRGLGTVRRCCSAR